MMKLYDFNGFIFLVFLIIRSNGKFASLKDLEKNNLALLLLSAPVSIFCKKILMKKSNSFFLFKNHRTRPE